MESSLDFKICFSGRLFLSEDIVLVAHNFLHGLAPFLKEGIYLDVFYCNILIKNHRKLSVTKIFLWFCFLFRSE